MKITTFTRVSALLLTGCLLLSASACEKSGTADESTADNTIITEAASTAAETEDNNLNTTELKRGMPQTCASLAQTGERSQRWLSVPSSRIVINPYAFGGNSSEVLQAAYSDSSELPLNIGYLDPYQHDIGGRDFEDSLLLLESTGNADAGIKELWSASFGDDNKWRNNSPANASMTVDGGVLSLTIADKASEAWQYAYYTIKADISADTMLSITVDSCEGTWALKLNNGKDADITIQGDTSKTGSFTYKLADYIGKTGSFRGSVKLFSIGLGKSVTISRLDVGEVTRAYAAADNYSVEWRPDRITASAAYPKGLEVEAVDFMCDTLTVARRIKVKQDGTLAVGGLINGAVISDDESTLTVAGEKYAYTIADNKRSKILYFKDSSAMYAGETCDKSEAGAFIYEVGALKAGEEIIFTYSIGSDAVSQSELILNSQKYTAADKAGAALSEREVYWNDYLTKIPAADTFEFDYVDSKGVTAEELEKLYCIAWIFTAQNILPENPELDYNYLQVCCGKPSMWGNGEVRSTYSATWESFFGIQLLAYVLPDEAWSAFTGLMSLVDDDGMLGGESLPSEKAHSAWVLYSLTSDSAKLDAVYDDIADYLDWRIENPRWIFMQYNDPSSADADFVESALIDIKYMIKIAGVVRPDDAGSWQKKYDAFLKQYYLWFFDAQLNTYQYCDKDNYSRSAGNTVWVTKGLYIPGIESKYADALIKRFDSEFDNTKSFCGFGCPKYPDSIHTAYGLMNLGYENKAYSIIEAFARDVARVGMFAEDYTTDAMPLAAGVRPSMFGCAALIDAMLLKSGISFNFRLTNTD